MNVRGFGQATIPDRLSRLPGVANRTLALVSTYLALAMLLVVPILVTDIPLGVDNLNHLARIHVRAHIGADPDLARLFEVRETLLPYLGMDWLLTPLARLMPTLDAGRLYIVFLLWALVGSVMVLQRVFTGRLGFEPALIGLVSYNALLAWGLLNYLLGVIVALLGFAAWHGLRERPWLLRLLLFTAVTPSLYFVHLLAFALYGLLLGSYELFGRPRAWRTPVRDWLLLGTQFVPAGLLLMGLPMPAPDAATGFSYILAAKPLVLASPFLFSGAGTGSLESGHLAFLLCSLFVVLLIWFGRLTWNRALIAPAIVLFTLSVALPISVMGVFLIDLRFPTVAVCLAVAAMGVAPGASRRQLVPAVLGLAALTIFHVASVTGEMRACDRQFGEIRQALQMIPRGEILTTVLERAAPAPDVPCTKLRVYDHIAQLITIERSGYASDYFGRVTSVMPRDGHISDQDPVSADLLAAEDLPLAGYVLWLHLGNRARSVPGRLTTIHAGSFFDLMTLGSASLR